MRKSQVLFFCLVIAVLTSITGTLVVVLFSCLHVDKLLRPQVLLSLSGAALAASVVVFWQLRRVAYREHVQYDVRQDYQYDFERSEGCRFAVSVDRNGFSWPAVEGDWDTGFLRLGLRASVLGQIYDPQVEVRSKHLYLRQYTERGAEGIRYVGISPVVKDRPVPGQRIWLNGRHLAWEPQETAIILFRNRPLDHAKVLVVAPHPDDAEIGAFGVYAVTDAFLVTITAGSEGGFSYLDFLPGTDEAPRIRASVRVWDSIMVPSLGGVSPDRAVNLGYIDGTLAQMRAEPKQTIRHAAAPLFGRLRSMNHSDVLSNRDPRPCWEHLVGDLRDVLERVRPEVVIAPHPLLDAHPDHGFTTAAICQAMGETRTEGAAIYLYVNHLATNELYPHGPVDGVISLPPCFEPTAFDAVYSHLLSARQRQMKYFALEAMHDLRPSPIIEVPRFWRSMRRFAAMLYAQSTAMGPDPHSYFRRALRPNELYFVVSHDKLRQMTVEFQERRKRSIQRNGGGQIAANR